MKVSLRAYTMRDGKYFSIVTPYFEVSVDHGRLNIAFCALLWVVVLTIVRN